MLKENRSEMLDNNSICLCVSGETKAKVFEIFLPCTWEECGGGGKYIV